MQRYKLKIIRAGQASYKLREMVNKKNKISLNMNTLSNMSIIKNSQMKDIDTQELIQNFEDAKLTENSKSK